MYLTGEQIETYDRNGYLVIEDHFSPDELELLSAELPGILAEDSDRRVLEKNGCVRTVFASHWSNEVFECFSRLERMIEPARHILDSEVYIHQFKINAKAALGGEQWEWHQDFLYWHREDWMPAPRVVTAVLFLQDVNEFNGPMMVVPGSHHDGMIDLRPEARAVAAASAGLETSWASTLTADLKYKVDRRILAELVSRRGIHAVTAPAGSVMFFHGNLFHASSNNLSPWDRISIFASYNSVENALGPNPSPRPEFIASQDSRPVNAVSDESLIELGVFAR
jgi:ectoine hydroxylase